MPDRIPPKARLPLLAVAMLALLAAMWAGLLRLGWDLPPLRDTLAAAHGPLMVGGFLGTLIGVERAVALGRPWAYLAPLCTALGALALLIGVPATLGAGLLVAGSVALLASYTAILRRQVALFTVTMALGADAWAIGNALWAVGRPIHQIVLWWAGFLVLTIAGERLELSRLRRPSQASQVLFLAAAGLFLAGLALSIVAYDAGARVAGAGMVALAAWLARYDVARRTVRLPGLPRFSAVCLLSGYVWLAAAGIMAVVFGGVAAGPRYDALLHAVFLGYVFAMIFAHAPIILPAVTGLAVPFHRVFYVHLILLHLSLLLRVGSDLTGWLPGRQWGGLLNVLVLLLFIGSTAVAVRRGRARRARSVALPAA
jgi:hypothetical protein